MNRKIQEPVKMSQYPGIDSVEVHHIPETAAVAGELHSPEMALQSHWKASAVVWVHQSFQMAAGSLVLHNLMTDSVPGIGTRGQSSQKSPDLSQQI